MDGNTRSGRLVASIWKSFTRSIHYKPLAPNKYPKVNVNDVDLIHQDMGLEEFDHQL